MKSTRNNPAPIYSIGGVTLPNKVILAPMAGITDKPFRLICRQFGVGLVYSEMISAKGVFYDNENTKNLLQTDENERPISVQLFGSDPDIIGEMAARVSDRAFNIIDINMGCPVPKIVKNGEGSALMKNPQLIGKIVESAVRSTKKPVSVKIRKGFDQNSINAVEVAQVAEASGASAVCVHGRTRTEFYSGTVDLNIIRQVKEAVKIPVIGSGDVTDGETAANMLRVTGCDYVMVGRGAQGNPWVFEEILAYLENRPVPPKPTVEERIETALLQARIHIAHKGERSAILEMRKHLCWYLKGIRGASAAKTRVNQATTLSEIEEILLSLTKESWHEHN